VTAATCLSPRLALLVGAAVALLTAAGPAAAQGANDYGSVYSRFGLGERADFGSPGAAAMGGAGAVSLGGPLTYGLENPALMADLALTGFLAGVDARTVGSEDAAGLTARSSGGGLAALALVVPLAPERVGLSISFAPYTRVNYRVIQEDSVAIPGQPNEAYRLNFEGGGGLYRLRAGLGVRPAGRLRLGASADVYFGHVDYLQRTEFPDSGTLEEVQIGRATNLSGVSASFGAAYRAPVGENRNVNLGVAVALPASLSGSRVRTLGSSLDLDTLAAPADGSARIPLSARAGAALSGPRWTLAAEGLYEPWSDFESDFDWGGYTPAGGVTGLNDRVRIGAGFQVIPGGGDRMAGFVARTAYRLGAFTETAVAGPGGESVRTTALTGGLSLPTLFPGARFDLGIEAGLRGAAEGALVRDNYIRGTVTLTFGERWFIRRRIG
jgi:hypothetical protein